MVERSFSEFLRVTMKDGSGLIIQHTTYALYHTSVPEYDITADGIMVYCKANQRYLELSGQEWVKTDDPIMAALRDDDMGRPA